MVCLGYTTVLLRDTLMSMSNGVTDRSTYAPVDIPHKTRYTLDSNIPMPGRCC